MKTALIITISIIIFLFLASFIVSLAIFFKSFRRTKLRASFTKPIYRKYIDGMEKGAKYFLDLNPHKVEIKSHDNLTLRGHLYRAKNSKGTVILVHGYHGEGIYDCSMVFKFYVDKSYSILSIDQRAHGKSDGKYLTFGVKECEDIKLWSEFIAKKYPDEPIILHGVSMGGATVCMASNLKLPCEVKAIIDDCGYTSPDEIISSVRKSNHLPFFPFQLYIRMFAKIFAGFSLKEKDARKSLENCNLPILFLHGEKDDFVPCYMGKENYESCKSQNKQIILVKDAGHALSYLCDPQKVENALATFLSTYVEKED